MEGRFTGKGGGGQTELQVCDVIIEEPTGGAHNNPQQTAENISHYLFGALQRIMQKEVAILLDSRYNKFRKIGEFDEGLD